MANPATFSDKAGTITAIAQRHLGIPTLERRMSDSLDFHDVSVTRLQAALAAAFEAGKLAARSGSR